ncbi:hypothetical protein NKH18_41250 [Streptomyces sp. M10(2022)]
MSANRLTSARACPVTLPGPAATKSVTARSYAGSGSVQLVNRPASRTAFSSAGSSLPAISRPAAPRSRTPTARPARPVADRVRAPAPPGQLRHQ